MNPVSAKSERWAILVVVTYSAYGSGGGVAMEIICGYPTKEEAERVARLIREDAGGRTAVFPEPDVRGDP